MFVDFCCCVMAVLDLPGFLNLVIVGHQGDQFDILHLYLRVPVGGWWLGKKSVIF
jgi:hypothetical protein